MDYRLNVCAASKTVYEKVVNIRCKHGTGSDTYAEMIKKEYINCSGAVSSVLKLAGCMSKGIVTHTSPVEKDILKKKTTVAKSMNGKELTDHIKWVYVGSKYDELPSKYKMEGLVYVQDSNICINAGGGYIWSCNCTGETYTNLSMVKKNTGYVKTSPILVVGIPEKKEEKKVEKKIVDIYHGNGITTYDEVVASTHFVVHKGCEGMTMVDDKCTKRIQAMEERKHPYWIYVFLSAGKELEQTKRMVELYKDKVGPHFVGWVLDIERNNYQDNCVKALEYLLKLPHKVMFYLGWAAYGKYPKLIAKRSNKCAYWEARYGDAAGNKAGTDRSGKYPFHSTTDLGQFTEYGKCNGITGHVDLNKVTGNKPLSWFTTPFKENSKKEGEKYTGELPALPPRGYWKLGDGKTDYTNYPTQIKRLYDFLIFAECYNGSKKTYIDNECREAIIRFQKKVNLNKDGFFGKYCLAAAKEYRK